MDTPNHDEDISVYLKALTDPVRLKLIRWAFLVGMVLYFLDALIFLLVQDWLSLGFHAFALVGIWGGFSSLRKLEALEVQMGLRPSGA